MKKIISTSKAPAAIGPYSQAIVVGDMVYTSGMIPIIPETGELETGDIKAQANQAIKNLVTLLEEAGSDAASVVKTTVFIKDMNDFAAVNEVYAAYFTENFPARSCVEVARLPKDVKIEIEAVAVLKQ
ncbi:MAG: RidA family protein [Lachnospiraceae bacterium]|nr:RidA family protein [Lachnospiraceae bacterium]